MSMRKRLARAIHKSGSKDPESIAEYLLKKGWTDAPAIVTPAIHPVPRVMQTLQPQITQLPDMRSLPVDHSKVRYLQ